MIPNSCAVGSAPTDAAAAAEGSASPPAACSNAAEPCFTWQSTDLLQGNKRVHIAHNGGVYQLQATRQGKLILTNIRPEIYEVFKITRLNTTLAIKDDEADGLALFGS